MDRSRIKNLILFIVSVFIFTQSYYRNFFGVVDKNIFKDFDVYCESQVLGRVIRSEQEGIFAEAGLNGWVRDDSVMKEMSFDDMTFFQFDIYKQNLKLGPSSFVIYDSQIGGQGIMFALLDKISPFSNAFNLKMFWFIDSLIMAVLITLFLGWVKKNFGMKATCITLFLLFLSPWLTFYGKDLYLVIWSFYFPFIFWLLLLQSEAEGKVRISKAKFFFLMTILVFFKLFFSGFEFITSALVMITLPVFFYYFMRKFDFKLFVRRFISTVSGAFLAIIIYAVIFSYQLSTLKGSMSYGFKYMIYSFLKRTHGNSADFPEGFRESLDASVFTVLKTYLNAEAFRFGIVKISMAMIILFLLALSLIVIYSSRISPSTHSRRSLNFPLMLTTWVSILGPLSWYVVFKAHSFVHLSIDELVWYMPFCFFGFAFIGSVLPTFIKDTDAYFESRTIPR